MYDHDEGRAVTDGFGYHGRVSALQGKFVFGDIQNGRVFAADLAEPSADSVGRTFRRTATPSASRPHRR